MGGSNEGCEEVFICNTWSHKCCATWNFSSEVHVLRFYYCSASVPRCHLPSKNRNHKGYNPSTSSAETRGSLSDKRSTIYLSVRSSVIPRWYPIHFWNAYLFRDHLPLALSTQIKIFGSICGNGGWWERGRTALPFSRHFALAPRHKCTMVNTLVKRSFEKELPKVHVISCFFLSYY